MSGDCYHTAFNALFFYWTLADGLKPDVGDREQVEHFVRKLGDALWGKLCSDVRDRIQFFADREPIEDMRYRSPQDPREGRSEWGERHRSVLRYPNESSINKLVALANILYTVRCNLCHGSKGTVGDDVTVIEHATPLLRTITEEGILYTERAIAAR